MQTPEQQIHAINLRALEIAEDVRRESDGDLNEMILRLSHKLAVREYRDSQSQPPAPITAGGSVSVTAGQR